MAALVYVLAATAQPEMECLSWCLSPLLGGADAASQLIPVKHDALSVKIRAASGAHVGDTGDYLRCIRIVNETTMSGPSRQEHVSDFALVQFAVSLAEHTTPTATLAAYFGCCVPTSCSAERIERGFTHELPKLLQVVSSRLHQTERQLTTLEEALSHVLRKSNSSNNSFSAAAEQLGLEASRANASGLPAISQALSAAAVAAHAAAMLDSGLRAAEALADRDNATAAASALREADSALLHGPFEGWQPTLEAFRAVLEGQVASLQASTTGLAALGGMVTATRFSVNVGSQRKPLNAVGWCLIVVFGLLVALVAVATGADVRDGRARRRHHASASVAPLAIQARRSEHTGCPGAIGTGASPGGTGGGAPRTPPRSGAEGPGGAACRASVPAPPPRPHDDLPLGRAALRCFSLQRNWSSLCSLRQDGTMDCLDGIRTLSMAWVVFGHTMVYAIGVGGAQYAAEILPKGWTDRFPATALGDVSIPPEGGRLSRLSYQLVPAAFFAVDTFFWITGVLTAFALLRQMSARRVGWFRLYPVYALGRWVRLTPMVAVAVAASVGLMPSLGDGPLYSLSEAEGEACAAGGWWVDLLYIQNLVSLRDPQSKLGGCERHFWYLANDMQFYLVAPLMVFPFVLSYRLGWAALGLLLAGSTAANAAIAAVNHYAASPLFDMTYFTRLYIQPWTRAQPFLVGVGFAALWTQLQERATRRAAAGLLDGSDDTADGAAGDGRKGPPVGMRSPPGVAIGLCGFAAVVMLATVFGTYGLYQELPSRWTDTQNVSFIALSRLGWALALSALAYVCFTRQAPLTNALLSWWPMQIWGKLAFGAYVSHPLLMTALYYSETRPLAYSDAWYARAFTTNLVWASVVALVLWLLIEKPSANLLALALARIGVKG